MIATMKAVMLALVVTAAAGTTAVAAGVDLPLQKAIDIHRDHLGDNSTMPEKSIKGQQNALDHLLLNQERWVANQQNMTQYDDNDTDEPDLD